MKNGKRLDIMMKTLLSLFLIFIGAGLSFAQEAISIVTFFGIADKSYVFVFDGGISFWRIDYDTQKKACFNFEVNGEA